MKLTFLGADHEVTGSCTLLSACGKQFLIDCGMEQGRDIYENQPIPMAPGELDGLFLTHAHIDHSGRIPLLYKLSLIHIWPRKAAAFLYPGFPPSRLQSIKTYPYGRWVPCIRFHAPFLRQRREVCNPPEDIGLPIID